jgi:hypothetical protein
MNPNSLECYTEKIVHLALPIETAIYLIDHLNESIETHKDHEIQKIIDVLEFELNLDK